MEILLIERARCGEIPFPLFREALGVRQIAPKPKKADEVPGERYERLMRQRYGALDRVR